MKPLEGYGYPPFCHVCHKPLSRAPGRGVVYYVPVRDADGNEHRAHSFPCARDYVPEEKDHGKRGSE